MILYSVELTLANCSKVLYVVLNHHQSVQDDRVETDDDHPAVNVEYTKNGQAQGIVRQLKNEAFILRREKR